MATDLLERLEKIKKNRFANCQATTFLSLLNKNYNTVLEVGCGKGFFSYLGALNKKFKHCFGCDIFDDYKCDEIKKTGVTAEYKEIRDNVLPYKDNMFDICFSVDVLEHIEDDEQFIVENIRVCKNGGEIIIGTPNYWRITNIFLKFLGRLRFPRKIGTDTYGDVIHLREYKKRDLQNLIKKIEQRGEIENIKIIGCWYGIMFINIGLTNLPGLFENFCQFQFVKFNKKQ